MSVISSNQRGFTFVELIIAMAIFSFILVIITSGIIRLFNIYQSGIGIRATQQNARSIADEISNRARSSVGYTFNQATSTVVGASGNVNLHQDRLCFFDSSTEVFNPITGIKDLKVTGEMLYTVQNPGGLGDKVFELHRARIKPAIITVGNCPAPGGALTTDDQLLSTADVSIASFGINRGSAASNPQIVDFDLAVAARTALDVLSIEYSEGDALGCHGTDSGNQYCSVTHIHSSAALRETP